MYWLVSLPLLEGRERTWNILQQKTTYDNELSTNFHFEIPELRVGTLDSLLTLSDDLVKVNSMMEAVVNKIRRQLFDMQTTGGSEDREEVLVEGNQPDNYIERFSWDEAKYPARQPLNETVKTMSETIGKLEDDLKVAHWDPLARVLMQYTALFSEHGGPKRPMHWHHIQPVQLLHRTVK